MDVEIRIHDIEKDLRDIHDRLGKTEDSSKSAWKAINEIKDFIAQIEGKFTALKNDGESMRKKQNSMEVDMQRLKITQDNIESSIKMIFKCLIVIAVVIVVTGIISMANGSKVPEKVVEAIIPVIKTVTQ